MVAGGKDLSKLVSHIKGLPKPDQYKKTQAPRSIIWKCKGCETTDQRYFIEDIKGGSTICTACGVVTEDHKIFDGDWTRHFEDDTEDKRQQGQAFNNLLNNKTNLNTRFVRPSDGPCSGFAQLMETQGIIDAGHSERGETRMEYKDKQKLLVFAKIGDTCDKLGFHSKVTQRANEMFATYRDSVDRLCKKDAVVGACIVLAKREVDALYSTPGASVKNYEELHPFQCAECEMRFSQRRDLRFHKCASRAKRQRVA